ncbi:hypothetical protein Q4578_20840, partial [Shimia thalassica]|uniref:hypothetical protein n=1 Tax=Shimia thalassica TaxID=1715693 RepID=UPI0026E2E684
TPAMSTDTPKAQRNGISPQSRRHTEMRREALKSHPELRQLSGTEPLPVLALPVLLAVQWGIAWVVSVGGFLLVGLTA